MFRRSLFIATGSLTLLAVTPRAEAQATPRQALRSPVTPTTPPVVTTPTRTQLFVPSLANQSINPNVLISPGLTLPQAAFNTAVFGQAISQVPPFALGFNPYLQGANLNPLLATQSGFGIGSPFGFGVSGLGSAALASGVYGGGLQTPYGGGGYGGQGTTSGYPGYTEDPTAGYLRGAASVIGAEGNLLNQVQKARLAQVQADSSRLDLHRRIADETASARKALPSPEAERQRDLQDAYTRATHEPPVGDILSGRALNDLFAHISSLQETMRARGETGRDVPLDQDMLGQINWTGVGSSGSIGLLKDQGKLHWPVALLSSDFDSARKEVDGPAADAVRQIRLDQPHDANTLRDLAAGVRRLNDLLLRKGGEMSPSAYVEAKRYVSGLESAVKALQDPGVARLFDHGSYARSRNVAELIDQMNQKGLRFAPATAGDEPAYRHMYQRLVIYDAAPSAAVAKQ